MLSHMKKKRANSTTSMAFNKGLLNEPGENNCFLNSAIQVLWHLDVFRRSFRLLSGHACMGAACIFCALKDIFQQFQYSKDHALPPNVLRSALAETFQQQNRFQLGLMDDAAECFENILNRIHVHIGNTAHEDVCMAPHCIPHQKFGLTLVQQSVCACGATSEPLPFIEMVHYVSATALCTENEAMTQRYGTSVTSQMFGRLIRVAGSWGDVRSCPSGCGAQIEMRKVLMNCPDVVSVGIVWDSDEPEVRNIIDLVHALGTTLKLSDLFHTVVDERASKMELYLVGMVCYYGKHYSTFFFHTRLRKWVYFDDAQVSEVGKRWSNVISKCIKGHHQPLLLLYANPDASQVSVATAPKEVTMLPGYSDLHNKHLIDTPLLEMPETDSLNSEGESPGVFEEESSGTESMQLSVTHSPKKSGKPAKRRSPLFGRREKQSDHTPLPKSHSKPDKKEKHQPAHVEHAPAEKLPSHPRTPESHPRRKKKDQHSGNRPVKGAQPESLEKAEEIRSRKPTFQWNLAAENQAKTTSNKVGHYVEPQPANWTTYKPYNHQSSKPTSKSTTPPFAERGSKDNPSRSSLSVKAVDSKGMATFCVTSKTAPVQSTNDYRRGEGSPQHHRAPSPTPSSQAVNPQQHRVSIGRRSPKDRRSSQSSQSSTSSAGRSSHSSLATAPGPKPSSAADVPSTSKASRSSRSPSPCPLRPKDGTLHDQAQSYCTKNEIDLTPIMAPTKTPSTNPTKVRPPLPPKPPFLSVPISASPTSTQPGRNPHSPLLSFVALLQAKSRPSTPQSRPIKSSTLTATVRDRCQELFRDADDLMEQSRAADNILDYSSALQLCLEATKVIETILTMENLPEEYLVKARIKHGDCINKSRILQRRRNIRHQSQGGESGRNRSSMTEADRHVMSPTNQVLTPSIPVITSTNQSPSTMKSPNEKSSPSKPVQLKDERLIKHFVKKESKDHLIDFNNPGMTQLQNNVHRMFEHQNQLKQHPRYRSPVGLVPSDPNSNNNNSAAAVSPPSATPVQNKPVEDKEKRTEIFVWKNPDYVEATSANQNRTITLGHARNQNANPQRDLNSETNMPTKPEIRSGKSGEPGKTSDEEVEETLKTLDLDPSRKYRSITPTFQATTTASLSQQRRSKTPSLGKEKLMRQTIGQRRGSDLKLRPKSAYDMVYGPPSGVGNGASSNADPAKGGNEPLTQSRDSTNRLNPYAAFPFPFPYPSWGSPQLMGPGFAPGVVSPQHYEQFYKWLQYYNMLSPEQRKMPTFHAINPPAPLNAPQFPTGSNMTAPPTMQAAYMENLKAHLGKNLTNFTNSVGRATPLIRNTNTNFYESSKPKPVNKTNPRLAPNDNASTKPIQRPIVMDANSRLSNPPVRRPPVESRPDSSYPRRNDPSTNQSTRNVPRDTQRPIRSNDSAPVNKRDGMMKWAEEGKKRTPETTVTPEYRRKLLQEFASRPRKDVEAMKQSVLQSYPSTRQQNTSVSSTQITSNPLKIPTPSPEGRSDKESLHKCTLCGLVDVPATEDYCYSCRAYLARLKPTVNSLRPSKNL